MDKMHKISRLKICERMTRYIFFGSNQWNLGTFNPITLNPEAEVNSSSDVITSVGVRILLLKIFKIFFI